MPDHVELEDLTFYIHESAASSAVAMHERRDGPDISPGLRPGSQNLLPTIPPTSSGSSQNVSNISEGSTGLIYTTPETLIVRPSPNRTLRRKLKGIHLFVRPTAQSIRTELTTER